MCYKLLDDELKDTKKTAQNFKTMELVRINLIFYNKITISTNFLAFFLFPDPGGKLNADPCGSGSTALDFWFEKKSLYLSNDKM